MVDCLADFRGLTYQPMPGTAECDQVERELVFAIEDASDDVDRTVLRFMVVRGYWPLGTRVSMDDSFQITAHFPTLV